MYLLPMPENRLVSLAFNRETRSGGMANDPNHSDRILLESFIGVADGSNNMSLEVGHPANVVHDGEIRNVIEEAVDREVPSQGIFRRRSKTICPKDGSICCVNLLEFRSTPKRGYLDGLFSLEENMNESETSADDPAVLKKGINLMGVGIGGNIEIFRGLAEEKVTNTSPDQISQESVPVKAVEDFQSLLIDHSSRDGMFRSWNDELFHSLSS